jgi:hypothetical protein
MKLKTVGRDSVEPKLDLRGKKSRFDPDKSGPHRQGQSATCRAKARRKRVRDCTPAPSHPVALIPLTVIPLTTPSHSVAPGRTQSNPVKPGQTNLEVVKNHHFVAFPLPFRKSRHLGLRYPLAFHYSPFTIHYSPFPRRAHNSLWPPFPTPQANSNLIPPSSTYFHLIPLNSTSSPPGAMLMNILNPTKLILGCPRSRIPNRPFSAPFSAIPIKANQGQSRSIKVNQG